MLAFITNADGKHFMSNLVDKQFLWAPKAWQQNRGKFLRMPMHRQSASTSMVAKSEKEAQSQMNEDLLKSSLEFTVRKTAEGAESAKEVLSQAAKGKQFGQIENALGPLSFAAAVLTGALVLKDLKTLELGSDVLLAFQVAARTLLPGLVLTNVFGFLKGNALQSARQALVEGVDSVSRASQRAEVLKKNGGPTAKATGRVAAAKTAALEEAEKLDLLKPYLGLGKNTDYIAAAQAAVEEAKAAEKEIKRMVEDDEVAVMGFPERKFIPAVGKGAFSILEAAEATEAATAGEDKQSPELLAQRPNSSTSVPVAALAGVLVGSGAVLSVLYLHRRDSNRGEETMLASCS